MKMFKKLMAVALAGVMALVVLTGCASNALNSKEIVDCINDSIGSVAWLNADMKLTATDEADAAKLASVLKEYKAKEEYKDFTVEQLLEVNKVKQEIRKKLVAEGNTDMVLISYAEVTDYQSKYFGEAKNSMIASELMSMDHIKPIAGSNAEYEKTGTASLKEDTFGDDAYVFAVVRVSLKKEA